MAAAADVTAPSPRSVAASLARALSLLAPAAADAAMCLCLAEIWLLYAGAGALEIARIAGAEHLAVAVAASKVVAFCDYYLLHALFHGAILFMWRLEKDEADDEVKQLARLVVRRQRPAVPSRLEAGWKEVRCNTVVFGMFACVPLVFLMLAGEDLLEMKGSGWEATGFVMRAAGRLGNNGLLCFVVLPTVALKAWRVTRPGWRSDSTFVKNP
ncbi:hypothetical protein EJB05_49078 [Eragrostis curvula]|uniref:Uncharacterized protein n=1 Tax=Eragrostis curvula TaxID=38414 RepID=A0A5J9T3N5_9POAL|nr:hypothetical protein EJB05_49078 [Eragrostis curvula]